jgi:hypothetical protein
MNHTKFLSLVKDLRKTQKDYFRTRSPYLLEKAKSLEKKVDAAIEFLEFGEQKEIKFEK